MEKWEYITTFMWANIDNNNVKEYLARAYPNWAKPPKFTPETMIPELNEWGKEGWEVIHMEPVIAGSNHDVGFAHGGDVGHTEWTNVYFVVMKRKLNSA